jgi:hypothetical protein
MLHQGWRHADYPGYVFGKKKCLVAYVRKNPKSKDKMEKSIRIISNYPKAGSRKKYSIIWQNTLPEISKILGNPKSSGSIALNSEDFALVGNRKSYSINLEFENGVVSNNISGSAVARDLAFVLTRSSIIKPVLNNGYFKFKMDKDFILWISK